MSRPRSHRSQSQSRSYHTPQLAGYARVEREGTDEEAFGHKSKRSTSLLQTFMKKKRWMYAVLEHDTLMLYGNRVEFKRKRPPQRTIELMLTAPTKNDSVFGFDQDCIYIRSKATQNMITLRIYHENDMVRWVTALYSLSMVSCDKAPQTPVNLKFDMSDMPDLPRKKANKSVSFQDAPQVISIPRLSDSDEHRQELFYSPEDYQQFLQNDRKKSLRRWLLALRTSPTPSSRLR